MSILELAEAGGCLADHLADASVGVSVMEMFASSCPSLPELPGSPSRDVGGDRSQAEPVSTTGGGRAFFGQGPRGVDQKIKNM